MSLSQSQHFPKQYYGTDRVDNSAMCLLLSRSVHIVENSRCDVSDEGMLILAKSHVRAHMSIQCIHWHPTKN